MSDTAKYYGIGSNWSAIELDSPEEGFDAKRFLYILKCMNSNGDRHPNGNIFPIDNNEKKIYLEFGMVRCLKIEATTASGGGTRLMTEIQDSNDAIRREFISGRFQFTFSRAMLKLREFMVDFADNYQTWEAWDAEQARLAQEKHLQEQNERYKKLQEENVALKQQIKELKDSLIEITGKLEQLVT